MIKRRTLIILVSFGLLFGFMIGRVYRDIEFQKGVRPWGFLMDRVIQSELDARSLEMCLQREKDSMVRTWVNGKYYCWEQTACE